jgi:hypothetical protein
MIWRATMPPISRQLPGLKASHIRLLTPACLYLADHVTFFLRR